jgi:hypothetical protein
MKRVLYLAALIVWLAATGTVLFYLYIGRKS